MYSHRHRFRKAQTCKLNRINQLLSSCSLVNFGFWFSRQTWKIPHLWHIASMIRPYLWLLKSSNELRLIWFLQGSRLFYRFQWRKIPPHIPAGQFNQECSDLRQLAAPVILQVISVAQISNNWFYFWFG